MTILPENESSKTPKPKDEAKSEASDSMLPDEGGSGVELEAMKSKETPVASSSGEQKSESESPFDEMENLFAEEMSETTSGGSKADSQHLPETNKSEDAIPAPSADAEPYEDLMDSRGDIESVEGDLSAELVDSLKGEHEISDTFETESDDLPISNEESDISEGDDAEPDSLGQNEEAFVDAEKHDDLMDSREDAEPVEGDFSTEPADSLEGEQEIPDIFETESDDLPISNEESDISEGDDAESDSSGQNEEALIEADAVEPAIEASVQQGWDEAHAFPELGSMDDGDSADHIEARELKAEVEAHSGKGDAEAAPEPPSGDFAHTPPSSPERKPWTGLGVILGLFGIIGAIGAVGMNISLSGRISQLEMQLAAGSAASGMTGQDAEIASINRRFDALIGQFSAHMRQVAQAKQAESGLATEITPATKVITPATEVTTPATEVITPATEVTTPATEVITPATEVITPSAQDGDATKSDTAPPIAVEPEGGRWVVNTSAFSTPAEADKELARLNSLGIHAESIKVVVDGRTWYRIRVPGFASAAVAKSQIKVLENRLGISDAWISRR